MRNYSWDTFFVLMFSFALPSFVDATVELNDDTIVEEYVPEEDGGIDLSNVDVSNFDFENLRMNMIFSN